MKPHPPVNHDDMTSRSISQVLVDGLMAQGVRQVFGVVGDALNSALSCQDRDLRQADLRTSLATALATPGSVVVDVLTNPDEIIIPSHPTPGQAGGFAIAKVKESIRSRGDDQDN